MDYKKKHYNAPQMKVLTVGAQDTVVVAGRATGKTEGMHAPFILNNARKMPRSSGAIGSVTYSSLVGKILPGVFKAFQDFGMLHGKHFWYNAFPDFDRLGIPRPIACPLEPRHYITFANGSGVHLLSLDRSMNNGVNLDFFCLDEARFAKRDRVRETILAVRGNREHFGHLSCHHSKLITTDRPYTEESRWILDLKGAQDLERVQVILALQHKLFLLKMQQSKNVALIEKYKADINTLQRNLLYFVEASTLENIHALGVDVIKRFKRDLRPAEYRRSILNEDTDIIDNAFYALLDEEKHGYWSNEYSYIDSIELTVETEKDCRWDGDILKGVPLEIGFDHNAAINCLTTGQEDVSTKQMRFLSSMHVEHPFRLKDLLLKWNKYYDHHPTKIVYYHYDHTSISTTAATAESFADEIIRELRMLGWQVIPNYIGHTAKPSDRFRLWEKVFKGDDTRLLKFSFNRENCETWKESCKQTRFLPTRDESYRKDKSKEKKPELYDQVTAPHHSDAGDTLMVAIQSRKLTQTQDFIGSVVG